MADVIVVKEAERAKHPAGQFVAQCVDVVDLGERVESFPGTPEKLVHKCALVFRTGEIHPDFNEPFDISKEFSVSMGDKANLRKALEQWRGKPYTQDELSEGAPLHKLEGNWAILTVEHRTSNAGRQYANISAIVGVPKAMQKELPKFPPYTRADFWATRKEENAKAVAAFKAKAHGVGKAFVPGNFDEIPAGVLDDIDDLPF